MAGVLKCGVGSAAPFARSSAATSCVVIPKASTLTSSAAAEGIIPHIKTKANSTLVSIPLSSYASPPKVHESMSVYKLLLLPGDGIGPEVVAEIERVVAWVNARGHDKIETETDLVGGCAYDAHGEAISDATIAKALR